MINDSVDLSIVVPVYNSSNIIPELVSRIQKSLSAVSLTYEVILTDDLSPDNSWQTIKEICRYNKQIRGLRLVKNSGQWFSTLAGMSLASGKFIVTIDDDLEYSPEDILKLHQTIISGNFQVVFGMSRQKYLLQGKNGQLARWRNNLLNFFWNKPPTDSFRILNRSIVFKENHFLPTIPIEAFLKHNLDRKFWGYCDVSFNKRYAGNSNHSFFKKIYLFIRYSSYYTLHPKWRMVVFSLFALAAFAITYSLAGENNAIAAITFGLGMFLLLLNFIYLSNLRHQAKEFSLRLVAEEC